MQGKVKWFSEEKGYGYIVGNDEKDHYFNISDVQGADLPRNGDVVSFESSQGKKGPRASSVAITAKGQPTTNGRTDDRATCPHCGKKMVPRLITYQGTPEKSLCPFCGEVYKKFSGCFITTAACEYQGLSDGCYELTVMRHFRDTCLLTTPEGRDLVNMYYEIAPNMLGNLDRERDMPFVWSIIQACVAAIANGDTAGAIALYKGMVSSLQHRIDLQHG